uniref:Cytochrome P450 9e2-like n=1 Tax=Diabrotica virgifera virgifera TaxID=50390 RepID=A0A6P7G998_DIAVI
MFQLVLVLAALAVLFYYFAIKPMSYWKERGIKQTKPVWLLGDNWGTVLKTHSLVDFVQYVYDQCPDVRYFGLYQMVTPTLAIRDPDLIKHIAVKDFEHFTDHRQMIPENADPLLGKNLFSLKGQTWRDMRPILSPTFTSSKMRTMFVLMSECGENFIKYFLNMNNKDTVEMEMKDTFRRFTNDVIATTAFGVKTDSLKDRDNEFFVMGKRAVDFGFWRSLKFFGYFLIPRVLGFFKVSIFGQDMTDFFMDLINRTVRTREEKGIVRPDMIHLLMEAKKGIQQKEEKVIDTGFAVVEEVDLGNGKGAKEITNIDIAAHAMVFFFAGFDGVSSLMCFTTYELAVNPDIQNRLREEIEETLRECNGKLTYEGLLKMKYLDMVVSETLRKWPIAVMADRICTRSYTIPPTTPEEKPLFLEKDTLLLFPIWAIHRDPAFYENPDRFDPERFNDENKSKINPYTYLPFGIGPRNCIGSRFALLETKVVLFYLLSNFIIEPSAKLNVPLKISKKQFNVTAEGGFWFNLKKLNK